MGWEESWGDWDKTDHSPGWSEWGGEWSNPEAFDHWRAGDGREFVRGSLENDEYDEADGYWDDEEEGEW